MFITDRLEQRFQKSKKNNTMQSTTPFSRQQRIANTLLLNASFIDNLGLMHGKMGIAIYFFHLARETKNQIYEDYAGELIDEIYDEITIHTPCDFENGLAGIGWGIEYLVQKGFVKADTNEVLKSIDNQIESSLTKPQRVGLLDGIIGAGAYYLKRLQNPNSSDKKDTTLLNKSILKKIAEKLELLIRNEEIKNLINGSDLFDIIWDYPILIILLAEIYQLNHNNVKFEEMLKYLVVPLLHKKNLHEQHSKRLQLSFALINLQKCEINQSLKKQIEELIQNLTTGLNRGTISEELAPNCASLRNGNTGIAYLYNKLYKYTGDRDYLRETKYWYDRSFLFEKIDHNYIAFALAEKKENRIFGVLEGLSGINLSVLMI